MPSAGRAIGRYEVLQTLGEGGMGTVFLASDPELDREIAIKVIRPERSGSEQARARFVREARAMAAVSHPNVVEVFDCGVSGGRPFVAMAYVPGKTLRHWLAGNPRLDAIVEVMSQAGRGLAAAHEAGLVHRDFKPENVLVDEEGRALVTDFGRARALEDAVPDDVSLRSGELDITQPQSNPDVTITGAMLGSPAYMAPEQHCGADVDARADQYAFAVTLHEMLLGRRPFPGPTSAALVNQKSQPELEMDRLPASLQFAIRRALHPEPSRRFRDMAAMLHAMREPGPRRRRATLALAGVAVAATTGFMMMPRQSSTCTAGPSRIAEAWDDGAAASVRAAFTESAVRDANAKGRRVVAELDAHAEAWVDAYEEICRSDAEAQDRDARMACLDDSLDSLAMLRELLETPDPGVVGRAESLTRALGRPSKCVDRKRGDQHGLLPADPGQREQAQAARRDLRRAKTLERVGRLGEARALAEGGLATARTLDHAPLLAHAMTTLASTREAEGEYEEAHAMLREAVSIAEADGAWRWAIGALVEESWVVGYRLRDPERGLRLSRQAEALLSRTGPLPQIEASLHQNRGALFQVSGRLDDACDEMQRALDIREANPDGYSNPTIATLAIAGSRENLGSCMVMVKRPEDAIFHLARAHEETASVLGADHVGVASIDQALAQALDSLGRFTEALEHAKSAARIYDEKLEPDDPMRAQALASLGYVHASLGNLADAASALRESSRLLRRIEGRDSIIAWVWQANAADAHLEAGELERAAELASEAERNLSRLCEGDDFGLGVGLGIHGRVLLAQGKAAESLAMQERGLAALERALGSDSIMLVRSLLSLAKAHRALDDEPTAIVRLERALEISALDSGQDPINVGDATLELAELLVDRDATRAEALARRARATFARDGELPDRVAAADELLRVHGFD